MIARNHLSPVLSSKQLVRPALQGAGIAFLIIIVFLSVIFSLGHGLSGKTFRAALWEFFPLITATAGGAAGGIVYFLVARAWTPAGWVRVAATIAGLLLYALLVWISLVGGFAATGQWD